MNVSSLKELAAIPSPALTEAKTNPFAQNALPNSKASALTPFKKVVIQKTAQASIKSESALSDKRQQGSSILPGEAVPSQNVTIEARGGER